MFASWLPFGASCGSVSACPKADVRTLSVHGFWVPFNSLRIVVSHPWANIAPFSCLRWPLALILRLLLLAVLPWVGWLVCTLNHEAANNPMLILLDIWCRSLLERMQVPHPRSTWSRRFVGVSVVRVDRGVHWPKVDLNGGRVWGSSFGARLWASLYRACIGLFSKLALLFKRQSLKSAGFQ